MLLPSLPKMYRSLAVWNLSITYYTIIIMLMLCKYLLVLLLLCSWLREKWIKRIPANMWYYFIKWFSFKEHVHTWSEFKIAKIHANTWVSLLTASMPINQVNPSNGKRNIAAFNSSLHRLYKIKLLVTLMNNLLCSCWIKWFITPTSILVYHFQGHHKECTVNLKHNY